MLHSVDYDPDVDYLTIGNYFIDARKGNYSLVTLSNEAVLIPESYFRKIHVDLPEVARHLTKTPTPLAQRGNVADLRSTLDYWARGNPFNLGKTIQPFHTVQAISYSDASNTFDLMVSFYRVVNTRDGLEVAYNINYHDIANVSPAQIDTVAPGAVKKIQNLLAIGGSSVDCARFINIQDEVLPGFSANPPSDGPLW